MEEMVKDKNFANNVDRVTFKGTITKWHLQIQTIRTARNTQINKM